VGTLYLVSTPIGNLEDMTARGLRLLREAAAVAAEDTRTARRLLAHFQIRNRLISYNEHNRRVRIPEILRLLETSDVALISEAGTPAVSDPGQELVSAAVDAGHQVVAAPGASAVLAALTASGLSTRQFVFLGFLPRQAGDRRALLKSVAGEVRTLICFEAPTRLRASLSDLLGCLGDRRLALCRELTKMHEEILRLRVSEALALTQEPRGEYTLVIEGAPTAPAPGLTDQIRDELRTMRAAGAGAREATTRLASEHQLSRRVLYEEWLALADPSGRQERPC
jgi:16S rRNA (cytidine1402-2'-O)-methyltransferase